MEKGFLDPNQVLDQIGLQESMVAADFGCGSGGWVIPLSRRLTKGTIYAIDILKEPISSLRSRLKLEGISNVKIVESDLESENGSGLPPSICDLVLMTNLLFEVEDRPGVIKEGRRVLKNEGRILIVDWKKNALLGPSQGRISVEEVKKLLSSEGLKFEQELEAGEHHYGLVFQKIGF